MEAQSATSIVESLFLDEIFIKNLYSIVGLYLESDIEFIMDGKSKKLDQFNNQLYKQIVANIHSKTKNKDNLAKILAAWDSAPEYAVNHIMNDPEHHQIFQALITEFYSWKQAYDEVVKTFGPFDWKSPIQITEEIRKIQGNINFISSNDQSLNEAIHRSYYTQIMIMVNRNTIKEQASKTKNKDLSEKWAEIKKKKVDKTLRKAAENKKLKEERLKEDKPREEVDKKEVEKKEAPAQKKQDKKQGKKNDEALKPAPEKTFNPEEGSSLQKKKKQALQLQRNKKELQLRQFRVKKLKEVTEPNHKNRINTIIKFLESRRDFTYANKQEIAKELEQKMMVFMDKKVKKLIHAAKLQNITYNGNAMGDEFRVYSNKNLSLFEKDKFTEMLPMAEQKILKIRYPSKQEQYSRLRIEEEKKEDEHTTEMRKKFEMDKKSDKFVQGYILTDQKDGKRTEFIPDLTLSERETKRLTIYLQSMQYVLEADPWFADQFVMEKTFYKIK